eukprot:s3662_g1.t1
MHVAGLVLLSALAFADASRVYTPGNLGRARRKDRLEEIEKSLNSMASLLAQQEEQFETAGKQLSKSQQLLFETAEQLWRARKLFRSFLEEEEDEAEATTTTTTRGQPPSISLEEAAKRGDVAALAKHREAGSDLNAADPLGWTAAHYAAEYGHAAALKFLHEAGANLDAKDEAGATPAHCAALFKTAGPALEAGADLNATNNLGFTPAFFATMNGNVDGLRVLIKAGADVQKLDTEGRNPAHHAALNGYLEELRLLIQAGVNLNATDKDGETPADAAARKQRPEALKLILEAGGRPSVYRHRRGGEKYVTPTVARAFASWSEAYSDRDELDALENETFRDSMASARRFWKVARKGFPILQRVPEQTPAERSSYSSDFLYTLTTDRPRMEAFRHAIAQFRAERVLDSWHAW